MRFLCVLLLGLSACAVSTSPSSDGDPDVTGKADAWGSALAVSAQRYAEQFDFSGETPQASEVDRAVAGETGPLWVRRAFALHHTWEANDLGVARLYKWNIDRHVVWAIRTSTDGDDSFIELFNGTGAWLATGVGGYTSDATAPNGYRPVIHWDATPGAVRDHLVPTDIVPEVAYFFHRAEQVFDANSALGAKVSLDEAKTLADAAMGSMPSTDAIDGWGRAALRKPLSDPRVAWTDAARSYAEEVLRFYDNDYPNLGTPTVPNIATTLHLPTDLATNVRFARVTNRGAAAVVGHRTFVILAQALGLFGGSALPADRDDLEARLVAAGCSPSQAEGVLHTVGADVREARVYSGNAFQFSPDYMPVQDPGTLWFIASPTKSFVSILYLVAPGDDFASWKERGEAVIKEETGVAQAATLVQVRERADRTLLDLTFTKQDLPVLSLVVEVPRTARTERTVSIRMYEPTPEPEVPTTITSAELATLAFALAQRHAEGMVEGLGDLPLVEVLLRTRWRSEEDLEEIKDPDESAVGFDPATEVAQYMLGSVWGDNAVFVTFAKDGTVRVEDFN